MGVAYQEKVISNGLISDLFCYTFVILSIFPFWLGTCLQEAFDESFKSTNLCQLHKKAVLC